MAAEFPFPSVSGSNPTPLFYEALPEQFVVSRTIYDDNGADHKLQVGGTGWKQYIIRYDGLLAAEAALLDSWAATVFYSEDEGSAGGFNFREHIPGTAWTNTSGTLLANCHLSPGGYKKDHITTGANSREFIIEKRS